MPIKGTLLLSAVLILGGGTAMKHAGLAMAGDAPPKGRADTASVVAGSIGSWAALSEAIAKEREAVVGGLIKIVNRSGDSRRSDAALALGSHPTEAMAKFCLENINLLIPRVVLTDVDVRRNFPCQEALRLAGWSVVPHLRPWVNGSKRPKATLESVGILLARICGDEVALSIALAWRKAAYGVGKDAWRKQNWTVVQSAIENNKR